LTGVSFFGNLTILRWPWGSWPEGATYVSSDRGEPSSCKSPKSIAETRSERSRRLAVETPRGDGEDSHPLRAHRSQDCRPVSGDRLSARSGAKCSQRVAYPCGYPGASILRPDGRRS